MCEHEAKFSNNPISQPIHVIRIKSSSNAGWRSTRSIIFNKKQQQDSTTQWNRQQWREVWQRTEIDSSSVVCTLSLVWRMFENMGKRELGKLKGNCLVDGKGVRLIFKRYPRRRESLRGILLHKTVRLVSVLRCMGKVTYSSSPAAITHLEL